MSQYSQNGRTGSFLAVNNGTVEGCIADIVFSCKNIGAGFVYENNAQIVGSASVKCIKGKLAKGFLHPERRNNHCIRIYSRQGSTEDRQGRQKGVCFR